MPIVASCHTWYVFYYKSLWLNLFESAFELSVKCIDTSVRVTRSTLAITLARIASNQEIGLRESSYFLNAGSSEISFRKVRLIDLSGIRQFVIRHQNLPTSLNQPLIRTPASCKERDSLHQSPHIILGSRSPIKPSPL